MIGYPQSLSPLGVGPFGVILLFGGLRLGGAGGVSVVGVIMKYLFSELGLMIRGKWGR
jgi:hypothetical protein